MTPDIYERIVEARRSGTRVALATIVQRKGSTPRRDAAKMLLLEDGTQYGTIGGGCTEAEVTREALDAMRTGKSRLLRFDLTEEDVEDSGLVCGGTMEVYVEPILPAPRLLILGAGHIGRSLSMVAHGLGFRIAVADDRIKYASRDRFPEAEELYADGWEALFPKLPVTSSTFLVIATRGHSFDLGCLRFALSTPARYIGLLGSRRKTQLLFEALRAEGFREEDFERVYAPVGLAIGSETPEEIAVSIAAELIAVRKNLEVRPLKAALGRLRSAEIARA